MIQNYSNAQYNNNTQTQSGQGNKSSNITVRINEKQTNPKDIGTQVKLKMFELLKCKYTYSVYIMHQQFVVHIAKFPQE